MSNTLVELSDNLASAVAQAGMAVGGVEARRRLPATGFVWSGDGVIVTAHHVIEQEEGISVRLPDGEASEADLVGRDPSTDLAVLRVRGVSLPAPAWAPADSVRVGHLVLALGRPGKTVMATLGMVSALGEAWRTPTGGQVDRFIRPDLTMYPGFSGGPLVASNGTIIGMNTTGLVRDAASTIPQSTIDRVVNEILAHGKVRRGHLGVGVQPARLSQAVAQRLGQDVGLLLTSIESDSPAERAGLLVGDILVALDGEAVRYPDELLALLSGDRVGTEATARIVRAGSVQDISVTIGEKA